MFSDGNIDGIMPRSSSSTSGSYISNPDGTRSTRIYQHRRNFETFLQSIMGGPVIPPSQHLLKLRNKLANNRFCMHDNAFGIQPTDPRVACVSPPALPPPLGLWPSCRRPWFLIWFCCWGWSLSDSFCSAACSSLLWPSAQGRWGASYWGWVV